jgi:hypothetical protein
MEWRIGIIALVIYRRAPCKAKTAAVQIKSMRVIERVNYLHYKDLLDRLESCLSLNDVTDQTQVALAELGITSNIETLREDVCESRRRQNAFRELRVRGFSYLFCLNVGGFTARFTRSVDLRAALFFDRHLFYPNKVRSAMRRLREFHCWKRGLRPIAFALGRRIEDEWYVLQLQSDIAFNCGSAIGNHFRGWSRVLLDCLHRKSTERGRKLLVCPSEQVIRAVAPASLRPRLVPETWRQIYDLSAEAMGMKKLVIETAVDLQLHPRLEQVLCREFYSFE